jgi:hypothetical protein
MRYGSAFRVTFRTVSTLTRPEPPESLVGRHPLGPSYLPDKKAPIGRTAWRRLNAIRQA